MKFGEALLMGLLACFIVTGGIVIVISGIFLGNYLFAISAFWGWLYIFILVWLFFSIIIWVSEN